MITRIDYQSACGSRWASIYRNDSGDGERWDVQYWGYDVACARIETARTLTKAQQVARAWCDDGRTP